MSTSLEKRPAGLRCGHWPLSVCSWSLRTDLNGVALAMRQLGVSRVNLALKPAFREGGDAYLEAVRAQPWTVSAATIGFFHEDYSSLESIRATGGIVPDEHWDENRKMVLRAIDITASLGVPFLTLHAGFIEDGSPAKARHFRDRVVCLADAAGERGIALLMETGQETANCLRDLLEELNHPALGINFDPANMILYGRGDPVEAVRMLGRWIRHVHIKDAIATKIPGTWGTEVPWGRGQVGGASFLHALETIDYNGALAIEREAGDNRLEDIRQAAGLLAAWMPQTREA
ncbi:MAG TPA: sugar phosphate isomerase/epimerase family protein [Kiritimatiellia bacterium]|nr:sugar phosphate isomerase/epimerase family protein [Kiritimatiellia bacterium]HPS07666.1 sugar phosphate isomerase/epimerase family protein [Kiritimatiellia bacterium]